MLRSLRTIEHNLTGTPTVSWKASGIFRRAGGVLLLLCFTAACDGEKSSVDGPKTDGSHGGASNGGASSDEGGASGVGTTSARGGTNAGGQGGTTFIGSNPSHAAPVNLRTTGNYVILAKTGVSTVPPSDILGSVGLSPAAASYISGFSLIADATNLFATSSQVTGKIYAATYVPPTPMNLTTAIDDMLLAFSDAEGRAPNTSQLGSGDIGGMTLTPGVYNWSTGLNIPTDVTLSGSATDVWIFQVAKNLTVSNATKVILAGGCVTQECLLAGFGTCEAWNNCAIQGYRFIANLDNG